MICTGCKLSMVADGQTIRQVASKSCGMCEGCVLYVGVCLFAPSAVQEWHIFGISTSTWRLRVLAPMNELRSSPLEHILMAVTGVSRRGGDAAGGGGGGAGCYGEMLWGWGYIQGVTCSAGFCTCLVTYPCRFPWFPDPGHCLAEF
jgi:hypothetical protein